MNIQFKSIHIDLTPALKTYTEKKMAMLSKLIRSVDPADVAKFDIEFSRVSAHHHKGNIFNAEIHLKIPKKVFRVSETAPEIYAAVDNVKNTLRMAIERYKELTEGYRVKEKKT